MADTAQKPLKAYSVLENDERTGSIYFARHRIEAHKWGANEHGGGELCSCTCRRTAWADRYAETKDIPAREAIAHGWWFECADCGAKLSEDELINERRLTVEGVIGSMFGLAFCDKRCAAHYHSLKRRRQAFESQYVEHLRGVVRARFGNVKFSDGPYKAHVYAPDETGGFNVQQARINFDFPGMTIAPASFHVDWPSSIRVGQVKGAYYCCNGDREAFEAFCRETREANHG